MQYVAARYEVICKHSCSGHHRHRMAFFLNAWREVRYTVKESQKSCWMCQMTRWTHYLNMEFHIWPIYFISTYNVAVCIWNTKLSDASWLLLYLSLFVSESFCHTHTLPQCQNKIQTDIYIQVQIRYLYTHTHTTKQYTHTRTHTVTQLRTWHKEQSVLCS